MKNCQKLAKFWLPVIFWLIIIFLFSSRPTATVSEIDWRDFVVKKTIHLIEFGILFILCYRAFKNTTKFSLTQIAFWALILTVIYGVTDEYHQTLVPGRTGTLRDIIIDGFGASIAWLALWKYLPKAPPRLKRLVKDWQII